MADTDIEDIIRRFYRKEPKMVKLWRRYKPFINAGVQELITYRVNFSSLSDWRCQGAFVAFISEGCLYLVRAFDSGLQYGGYQSYHHEFCD